MVAGSSCAWALPTISYQATNIADLDPGEDLWHYDYAITGPLGSFESINLLFSPNLRGAFTLGRPIRCSRRVFRSIRILGWALTVGDADCDVDAGRRGYGAGERVVRLAGRGGRTRRAALRAFGRCVGVAGTGLTPVSPIPNRVRSH